MTGFEPEHIACAVAGCICWAVMTVVTRGGGCTKSLSPPTLSILFETISLKENAAVCLLFIVEDQKKVKLMAKPMVDLKCIHFSKFLSEFLIHSCTYYSIQKNKVQRK